MLIFIADFDDQYGAAHDDESQDGADSFKEDNVSTNVIL